MDRKKYSKPFMYVDKFVPQEYCSPCNWQGVYTSGGVIYSSSTPLYYDGNDNGRYNSGEKVNTPTPPSNKTFKFSLEDNTGNVEIINSTGMPHLVNIIPDEHNYYTRYYGNNDQYGNQLNSLYVLITTNNKKYYFSGNQWTFTKLRS